MTARIFFKRLREAAGLVFRPHPWATGLSTWDRWTVHLVGPAKAWMIAGFIVDAEEGRP